MAVTPDPHALLSTSLALYKTAEQEQQSVGKLLASKGSAHVQSLLTAFENFLQVTTPQRTVPTTVVEHRVLRQLFDSDPTKAFAILLEGCEEAAKQDKALKPQVARVKELFSKVHIDEKTIGLEKLFELQKALQQIAQSKEKKETDILLLQKHIKSYCQEQHIDYNEFVLSEDVERLLIEIQVDKLLQSLSKSETIDTVFNLYSSFAAAVSKIRDDHELNPSSEISTLVSSTEKNVLNTLLEHCIENMDTAKTPEELVSTYKKLHEGFSKCHFSDPIPFLNDLQSVIVEKATELGVSEPPTPIYQPSDKTKLASGKTISHLVASRHGTGFQPSLLQRIKLQVAITLVHSQLVLGSAALGYMTQAEPASAHMAYALAFCGLIAGVVQVAQTLPKSYQNYVAPIAQGLAFIHFITRFDAVHKITNLTQEEDAYPSYLDYFNPLKTVPQIDLSLNQTSLRVGPSGSDIASFTQPISLEEENSPIPLQPALSPADPRESWCFWPKLPLTEYRLPEATIEPHVASSYNVSTLADKPAQIPLAQSFFKETVGKTNAFWQSLKWW